MRHETRIGVVECTYPCGSKQASIRLDVRIHVDVNTPTRRMRPHSCCTVSHSYAVKIHHPPGNKIPIRTAEALFDVLGNPQPCGKEVRIHTAGRPPVRQGYPLARCRKPRTHSAQSPNPYVSEPTLGHKSRTRGRPDSTDRRVRVARMDHQGLRLIQDARGLAAYYDGHEFLG